MKQLRKLWEGECKLQVINGNKKLKLTGGYVISKAHWKSMDSEVAESTKLVPAELAPYLESLSKRGFWNADSYSYFLMHLGPIILKDRLAPRYYQHFVRLSELTQCAAKGEIRREEVDTLEKGLVNWVKDFGT